MPAFLTHWRILIETARQSQDAGSDLGSLIIDATALRRRAHGWSTPPQTSPAGAVWDTGPLPEIDFHFPGSDISAMAFLGALAPDIMYYHRHYWRDKLTDADLHASSPAQRTGKKPQQWSELFHRLHSGDILIAFLEQVALVPAPALRSQALAFALGYVSHIAADIALHPWINTLASHQATHRVLGPHFSIELRLDEYLATTYFEHPRYSLFYQPWGEYIEPAARNLRQPGALTGQLLQLLANAAEAYGLDEEQTATLPQDFLAGLQGLRHVLAGRGKARWLTLSAGQHKDQQDILSKALGTPQSDTEVLALDKVLNYATRLSVHLCRCAIQYYAALRNPNTEASARSNRRTDLINSLRNWNLYTGYATDDHTSPRLHNWTYFSNLWALDEHTQEERIRHMLSTS